MEIFRINPFWKGLTRLLGSKYYVSETGLFVKPCKQVHTFFTNFAVDVIFLDEDNRIIHLETIKPFTVSKYVPEAKAVIEFLEGTIGNYQLTLGQKIGSFKEY